MRRRFAYATVLFVFTLIAGAWSQRSMQSAGSVRYTALGDSLAAGVGGNVGYVERYRSALEGQLGIPVQATNLGCSGCKTTDLLSSLRGDGRFRDSVAQAQVVSWDIGGNDLLAARGAYQQGACGGPDGQDCLRSAVEQVERNWDAIIAEIMGLSAGHDPLVVTMDVYDPFVGVDQAGAPSDTAVFTPYLDELTTYMASSASANGVVIASARSAFNGPDGRESPVLRGLMAGDIIHPNDTGYQLLANIVLDASRSAVDQLRAQLGG